MHRQKHRRLLVCSCLCSQLRAPASRRLARPHHTRLPIARASCSGPVLCARHRTQNANYCCRNCRQCGAQVQPHPGHDGADAHPEPPGRDALVFALQRKSPRGRAVLRRSVYMVRASCQMLARGGFCIMCARPQAGSAEHLRAFSATLRAAVHHPARSKRPRAHAGCSETL